VDLYRQDISLALLRVLNNPEADVLVVECLPSRLPKLVKLIRVAALPYRPSSTIDLDREAVVGVLGHGDISPIAIITTIAVGGVLYAFVIASYVDVVIRVEEEVVLMLRAIASVTIIVEVEAIVRILIYLIRFPKRVFAGFAL
jgi:hypothetical protein